MENKQEEVKENNIIDILEVVLQDFCQRYNIDDIRKESQNIYNAFLMYAQKEIYPDKQALKYKYCYDDSKVIATNNNIYNYDMLYNIADRYIYFTIVCDKEVSLYGYSLLLGIDYSNILEWYSKNKRVQGLTYTAQSIAQKITASQEESLSSNLTSGKRNPVGSIAKLNSKFMWNSNGYNRQDTTTQALTVADLPKLGQNAQKQE